MRATEPPKEKIETRMPAPRGINSFKCWMKLNRRARLTGFLGFAVLLLLVFINPLLSLVVHAAGSEVHSYILLVPFISAYIIHHQRKQLPREYDSSPGLAMVPLVAGLAAAVAGWLQQFAAQPLSHNDFLTLMTSAFICFLAAGGFFFLGRKWMSAAAVPAAFLMFMVPLPDRVVDWLETASKLASTEVAAIFFSITGTPFLRNGVVFQLPGIVIEVGQECSGIRSSLALFISGLLVACLFLKSPWRRTVLVAAVILLGVVRNGFRIMVIGLLCVHVGPHMIHSMIHKQGGPLFFAVSLVPLFALLWWLRRGDGAKKSD